MSKRGRFQGGGNNYAGIPQQIINQIRKQSAGGSTGSNPAEPTPPAEGAPSPKRTREPRMLTAEEIAADPVLSGKISIDQAKVRYIKAQQALNLMPSEGDTGSSYTSKLKKANKAISALGFNPVEAERQFFALGGRMQGKGKSSGSDYAWSAKKILDYWRSAGMEDKGYEIVGKIRGYDKFGNPVEGGASQNTVDYRLKDNQFKMLGQVENLNALQSARLTKLKNLKQSGGTLTSKQQANLKRLRQLKNG